jgi:ankyrin repeat protein
MSNKSIQQELLTGLKEIYKDAEAKKIDKDNFLDIYIPSINPAKGTHLFFNTSKSVIKIGYYVRDEKFIKSVVEKPSTSIEAASNGLRVLGNPEFKNVKDALIAAKKFLSVISNSKTDNSIKNDFVLDKSLKTPLNKSKGSLKTNKTVSNDIIDDFDNAVKAFKNKNLEAVAKYVEAGNPVLQFTMDNGVIDNFLIAMTSGGNLNKEKLDLYVSKGLDLDATTSDDDAYTSCHFAAWDGNEDVLKMLIDAGANPDVIGGDTMTALNLASANGHFDCVKLLVSSGANIENRVRNSNQFHSDKGGTALRDAVINSFWELADYLIKSGASIEVLNEKCSNGEDFFTAVRRIYLGLDNKENNLKKIDELEKNVQKII